MLLLASSVFAGGAEADDGGGRRLFKRSPRVYNPSKSLRTRSFGSGNRLASKSVLRMINGNGSRRKTSASRGNRNRKRRIVFRGRRAG